MLATGSAYAKPGMYLDKYELFLNRSFSLLGYDSAAEIAKEREAKNISRDNIFYFPQGFYERMIELDGLLPMMLYNSAHFAENLTEAQLAQKLDEVAGLRRSYNAIRNDENNFKAIYIRWKTSDPALKQLSEEQKRALFALKLFHKRYVEPKEGASFIESVSAAGGRMAGDCDTLSYMFTDLLLSATGANRKKLFSAAQMKFDVMDIHFADNTMQKHIRIRIAMPADDVVIEATTANISSEKRMTDFVADKKVSSTKITHIAGISEALGYNLYGEESSKKDSLHSLTLAFTRSIQLVSDANELLAKNFDGMREYLMNVEYNKVIADVNKLAQNYNAREDLDEELFDHTLRSVKKLEDNFGEQRADLRQGYMDTLKQVAPKRFEMVSGE